MKTGKKIVLLLLVFLAAAVVYFLRPSEGKEEHGVTAYTAMEKAKLPVVYPGMNGREMAPLFGQTEEKALTAGRDSLVVLPADRKLPLRIAGEEKPKKLGYEIRSLDGKELVERTEDVDWTEGENGVTAVLPIQNLLTPGTEYLLCFYAELSDGTGAWYYTRILEADAAHVEEMLALAEEFSGKTLNYEAAQELTMYMETTPNADNTSFGNVTLKNSFTQMTWGTLGVERAGNVSVKLKELSGDLANIELSYRMKRQEGETEELYDITENFTMKWASQRIYMMDYARTMNQLFTGDTDLISGQRILLGIEDGRDLHGGKSAGGQYTAFVANRELWLYDSGENRLNRVFAFGGAATEDARDNAPFHGVELLSVDEDGGTDFLVYGRMNRGRREGQSGVSYYHYDLGKNVLEEQFFIPSPESFAELRADIGTLAHTGENGIFYLFLDHTVYGVDLKSLESVVVASGLTDDTFAVNGSHSRIAWQENTGTYDSPVVHIMDLDTGIKSQVGGKSGTVSRLLGFVGNDCVYGTGTAGDYVMSNGRRMGLYLESLDIVDRNMETAMHYEKDGYGIRDVAVDESRIHIKKVREKDGYFGAYTEDTLVCNTETLPAKTDDIGWYASDLKGKVYFVQLSRDASQKKKGRTAQPKLSERQETVTLQTEAAALPVEFYAYGRGEFLGRFVDFSEAAAMAYSHMGFVAAGPDKIIWIRANKPNSYYIRDFQGALRTLERYEGEFSGNRFTEDGTLLLQASGCSLSHVLYFVGRNIPVRLYTGEGESWYLTGYDQSHVRILNGQTGETENLDLDTAAERFEKAGNDYICCIPGDVR